jgi:hypothetical protein
MYSFPWAKKAIFLTTSSLIGSIVYPDLFINGGQVTFKK